MLSPKNAHNTENILNPEGVGLPKMSPPSNHGHTQAAWFLTIVCIFGAFIAALGLPLNSTPMVVIGAVIAVVGLIGGVLLSALGRGQTFDSKA